MLLEKIGSDSMSYQSEAELEKQLIQELNQNGYEKVEINTEEELLKNFRKQLYLYNQAKMKSKPFSEKEFERVIAHVLGKSIFQSAKIMRDKFVLDRDDGTQVYLEFFDSQKWCKNIFQVTNQTTVVGKYSNRYDVTILINGLPMVQIELKRRGLDIKEAFNQIERYRKHSYQGLYRYIQIFVISNGMDTKYFANTDRDLLYSLTFFWSDEKNERISKLGDFTKSFLERCHVSKIIARYMIINDSEKTLMVMRPYQIYAVEALVNRAIDTKNNGYIWHTTGSGKTLTSFKASQIISNELNVKKVFFLVDRKDLDAQTINEFNKFEVDSVDMTNSTYKLVKQIKDINKSLIVTTIQKMANAVTNPQYSEVMDTLKDEKVIFIIDECHRSQFGDMHKDIEKHFNNAQYFGFTGTPRFYENRSQDGRVTADLFEKCLHTYLIKDAIKDNNVLGFSVEYIKTFDGDFDEKDEERVMAIDTEEVFMDDSRIELVAKHIAENHNLKTRNKQYTAIFTVQSIPMLIKYYDAFKKVKHDLKISAIYTYGANEEAEGRDEHSRDSLERIIKDYNIMFSTNYSTETFNSYFTDVSKKVKSAQLDILIVVNMFLTGFDSKTLNTLYVDKNLKYHDLLQAFSRTNRVEKATKPYGNIVCYRNLKNNTDDAITLFSQTDKIDTVIMQSYEHYLEFFKKGLHEMYALVSDPEDVDLLETEEDKKSFIISFRELSRLLLKLKTFTQFEFNEDELGISDQKYQDFKSKYLLIYDNVRNDQKVSILSDIDFSIELMQTDKINVSYIMNLIRNIDLENKDNQVKDIKHIEKELDRADNEELRLKIDLIKSFLNKVVPTLEKESSIDDAYLDFANKERIEEINNFAKQVDVEPEFIKKEVSEYEYSGIIDRTKISDNVKKPFMQKRSITQKIVDFIIKNTKRYQ